MTAALHPDLQRAADLLDQADEAFERAQYADAEAQYRAALALVEPLEAGSPEPGAVLKARCHLGLGRVLNTQARFAEARALVEPLPELLVMDPLRLAVAVMALSEITANQGDLPLAMQHANFAYTLRVEWLGPDHPDTLDSLSFLALFYQVKGDLEEARHLMGKAVDAAGAASRPGSPLDAAKYRGAPSVSIGRVYARRGHMLTSDPQKFELARDSLKHALAIFEAAVGPEHPDYALALNNLAFLLTRGSQWGEARGLLLRSLAIHERAFGPRSAYTTFVLLNLSDAEQHLDNLEAAYHYAARALIAAARGLGARSPQALTALRRVVKVLGARSQAGDETAGQIALPFEICLAGLEAAAGKLDPRKENQPGAHLPPERAAGRLERLVDCLERQTGSPRSAGPAELRSVGGLPPPPRSTEEQAAEQIALADARKLAEQADEARANGDADRAYDLYTRALALQETILGPAHLDHLPLLEKLAEASTAIGHPSGVLPLCEQMADILTEVLGEDHPQTLLALARLYGALLYEYGEEAAADLRRRILAGIEQGREAEDPQIQKVAGELEMLQAVVEVIRPGLPREGPSRSQRIEAAAQTFEDPAGALDGLALVDWHAVSHAYGPADDVPRLLRGLLSSDRLAREETWDDLLNRICHQGTLYPATAAAAPFLIRLLDDPAYPDRLWVMDTLAGWAESSAYQALYTRPGSLLADRAEIQARIAQGKVDRYLTEPVIEQVNRAVAQGLPKYLELLDDPDPEMRRLALFTLSRLRDRQDECIPAITGRLDSPADPGERAELLCALRALLDAGEDSVALFTRWLNDPGEDPRVTFHAAAGVIERSREQTPDRVAAVLALAWQAARKQPQPGPMERKSLHGIFDRVPETGLEVLANLGEGGGEEKLSSAATGRAAAERGAAELARVLPLLRPPLASDSDLLAVAGVMLDLLFGEAFAQVKITGYSTDKIEYHLPKPPPPRDSASLTTPQRAAMETLLALEAFWETRHNLLALYGLPQSREDLGRFLSGR